MVTTLHHAQRKTMKNDNGAAMTFAELMPQPDIKPDLLLKLSGKLQTTLEVELLLEIFFNEIKAAVLIDGLSYTNNTQNITVNQGRSSIHSCSYRLTTQKDYMGELIFSRNTRFREHELANLEGLVSTLVYPLRNALRYHEAIAAAFRDPLTGAGNRIALDKTLTREIELAKRHGQPLSVLMLDLDHFKLVNDNHGHGTGDSVLKAAVSTIEDCIRSTDMCFRYGGEEFLVMLSNADHQGAMRIADRIRDAISQLTFNTPEGELKITTSIGASTVQPHDNMESLCERADTALYQAKDSGRNKVIGEQPEAMVV